MDADRRNYHMEDAVSRFMDKCKKTNFPKSRWEGFTKDKTAEAIANKKSVHGQGWSIDPDKYDSNHKVLDRGSVERSSM
jgi:hypothetical protein